MDSQDRGFIRLTLGAVVVTFLMIVIGAITRVTQSGMGCGPYWPSCNGLIIPEFKDATVGIEFGHRLFALLVGVFTVAVAVQAWRKYRAEARILGPAMIAVGLFFVQSGLGAVTVALNNAWLSVAIHLSAALFLLATFTICWTNASRLLGAPMAAQSAFRGKILPPIELALATTLAFVVIIVGAAVAGTNATKVCSGWPLCAGDVWPVDQGPLHVVNMTHRIIAGSLGLILILMTVQAVQGVNRAMRRAVFTAFGLYLAQAGLGALVVLTDGREVSILTQSLHVLFASATWAALITASTIAWLQLSPKELRMAQAQPIGVRSATISS